MNEKLAERFPVSLEVILACLVGFSGAQPLLTKFFILSPTQIAMIWMWSVAGSVVLLTHRRWPNTAIAIFLTVLFMRALFLPNILMIPDVVLLVMIYSASIRAHIVLAIAVDLVALYTVTLTWIWHLPIHTSSQALLFATTLGLLGTIAFAGFARRRRITDSEKLLTAQQLIQQETQEQQHGALVRERTRIARDLHDIVAHTLGVVISQADGGRYAGRKDPQKAVHALDTIADMSRAALADIRSIVGVLREPNDNGAALRPQPVSHDITTLITQVKESGYDISFIQMGAVASLPAGIGNMLYRICQESITNSMKHGGPKISIVVKLQWHEDRVTLSVIDNGRGASVPNDGRGHGIIGMTERAELFGGTLEAGPRPGGGFLVHATIPYDKESREERL